LSFSSLSILYSKQRYGHRSTSLTPITSAMLCYVMLLLYQAVLCISGQFLFPLCYGKKVQINEIFIVYMLILTYSGITYYFLCYKAFNGFSILYSKQRYGHRSTSLTPITSAMLCYVKLYKQFTIRYDRR